MIETNFPVSVLIVDDNPAMLTALAAALESMDIGIVTATSGEEALRKLMAQDFAAVLLDVNMPVMDGFETATMIRSRPKSEHMPILFVTAERLSDDARLQGYALGAVDYILSPILPQILRSKVTVFADLYRLREQIARQNQVLEERVAARTVELRGSEARYRRITDGITDYLYTVRIENGRAVATTQSPACVTVTGYTAKEFAADPYLWLDMVVPEDRERVLEHVRQILAGQDGMPIEHRITRKDGEMRWVSDTTILFRDATGKLLSYDGVIKDITERKQAARTLAEAQVIAESEEKFRKITESAQDAIIMMGADKCISLWNPAAERIFGHTAGEALGKEMHALLAPPEAQTPFEQGFQHFLQTGTGPVIGKKLELTALRKGRVPFPVEVTISALQINGLWNAIGIFRDITERKQAEQRLRASLAEKEVLMREIHHRVKNNLQMMSALLELQSGYVKDEQVQGFFKDCQQRIQSMAMIHEQLYHNKNLAKIDFAAYLRSLMDKLRGQFSECCSQVNIRIDASACTLPVDTAIPCGLVVTELVSNVFKHAFPNGRTGELRIGLQCGGEGKVILEVADDGVGLPAGLDMQHSKSFGMQVVRLMVEKQLHGKLSVESNGHGRFHDETVGATSRSRQSSSNRDLEVAPTTGTRVVCEIGGSK